MHERNDTDIKKQTPRSVTTREQFDDAVGELFRTGHPIEVPSLEALARWV